MEASECGAAALGMILAYYGRWVPLDELRRACGVSRDGTRVSYIAKAAAEYGLQTQAFQVEPEGLASLALPAMLFWHFNHFVVLEAVGPHTVRINDPAEGRRTMNRSEFLEGFTTLAYRFTPTATFRREGSEPSMRAAIAKRLAGSAWPLAFVIIASVALGLTGLGILAFARIFIDEIIVNRLDGWLMPLTAAMGITLLMRVLLGWLQRFYLLQLKNKMVARMSVDVLQHLLRLPLSFFLGRNAGDIAERMKSLEHVGTVLSLRMSELLAGLTTGLVYAAAAIAYDPQLAGAGFSLSLITVITFRLTRHWRRDATRRTMLQGSKLAGEEISGLQLIETLKSMGLESQLFRRLAGMHATTINERHRADAGIALIDIAPAIVSGLSAILVLWLGVEHVMQNRLSIGELVAFQALLGLAQAPLQTLIIELSHLQQLRGDFERVDDLMHYATDSACSAPDAALPTQTNPRPAGRVVFREVTFGYDRFASPLIDRLSFEVAPGDDLAIVGPTGGGKSTIVNLLTGLYRPWSGEILIDGVPVQRIPADTLARTLGCVSQDIFLFDGTILENLTMWDRTTPEAAVVRAAQTALAHDFIVTRPGRYQAPVIEAGANFSGGQAQRLELARALVAEPRVLILDEATSALDAQTEEHILERLRQRGMTRIIIAHRLSAIRDSKEIVVIRAGAIVERGQHEQLWQHNNVYAELLRAE